MDLGKDWAVCAAQFSRAFGLYPDRDDRGIAQRRGTLYEKNERAGGRYFDFRVFPCLCR